MVEVEKFFLNSGKIFKFKLKNMIVGIGCFDEIIKE